MRHRNTLLAGVIALSAVIAGCSRSEEAGGNPAASAPATAADHSADERTIVAADSGWMRNVMAKNVDSLMMYYTPDAVSYGFGPPATGADAIRALYTEMVKSTISDTKIVSNTVRFSDDGSMAYDHGTYSMTLTPPGGKAAPQKGAYLNVWRKVDAQWKLVAEMSSPLPADQK